MIFYFSGTGNSKWIANTVSSYQQERLISIAGEMTDPANSFHYTLQNNEKIGFVFPVYSWAPPAIVLDFLRKIRLENYHGQYMFFICSCGDEAGLTLNKKKKESSKKLKFNCCFYHLSWLVFYFKVTIFRSMLGCIWRLYEFLAKIV